jgi:hypothetical protein
MGSKFISAYVETQKTKDQLDADVAGMLRSLGGILYKTPAGFQLLGGQYGVSMSALANLTANINVHPIKENKYEIQIFLSWTWGTLMWVFLVIGILGAGFPLLLLLLYLMYDPLPTYQQALYRLVNFENL